MSSDEIREAAEHSEEIKTAAEQTIDRINGFLTHEAKNEPSFLFGDLFLDLAAQIYELDRPFFERLAKNRIKSKLGGAKGEQDRWERAVREQIRRRASQAKQAAQAASATSSGHQGPGRPLELHDPPPCALPVDGATLLAELVTTIRQYIIVTEPQAIAIAVWIIWSHLFETFDLAPRLSIESPVLECGKTTLLDLIETLTRRPVGAAEISPAAIYRTIEVYKPTLLLDELDGVFRPGNSNKETAGDILTILNSGHTRAKANVIRLVKDGDDFSPRQFSTFTPIAHAMIGHPPTTLRSRAIVIALKRKRAGEKLMKTLYGRDKAKRYAELEQLAQRIARWAVDNAAAVAQQAPAPPFDNRAADNWTPLLSVAHAIGGDWPGRARAAAQALAAAAPDQTEILGIQLLADIRTILGKQDRINSTYLCDHLQKIETSPWSSMPRTGKPITTTRIASILRGFEVIPAHKDDGNGYAAKDLADAFARYLPFLPDQPFSPSETIRRVGETGDPRPFSAEGSENDDSSTQSKQNEGLKGPGLKIGPEEEKREETEAEREAEEQAEIDRLAAADAEEVEL